jgi:hypothetical protein
MDMDECLHSSISMMSWTQEARYSSAKQETNFMDIDDSISMMCVTQEARYSGVIVNIQTGD